MTVNRGKLDEIFKDADKDKPAAILVHPSPDPDCLGAAAGFSILLKEVYGLSSEIYHFGEVSHDQNKSIKNVLRIPLKDGNDFDPDEVGNIIVLDTDLENSGFKSKKLTKVDVRIDHHNLDRDDKPAYSDVRPVGSTCAIVWDYLRELEVDLVPHPFAATALVLGIKTDTLDFTSATTTDLDIEAHKNLLPFASKEALAKVTKYEIRRETFEYESLALANKKEREGGTTLVSFIGELNAKQRDLIASIADRFSRMAGISTVVIMAVIDDHLQASIRSDDSRVDTDDMCIKVFGKKHAGGKDGSGGARLPLDKQLEYINTKEARDVVIKEIVLTFENKLFDYLGEKEATNNE